MRGGGKDAVDLAFERIDADEDSSHIEDNIKTECDPYVHSDGRPDQVCLRRLGRSIGMSLILILELVMDRCLRHVVRHL